MNTYIQVVFDQLSQEQSELLMAALIEAGYEGFEEEDHCLKGFIAGSDFDQASLDKIAQQFDLSFSKTVIEETNWNQIWESGFQPVVIGDFVSVRAGFHEPVHGVEYEIMITPKMSFGTGHHATTHMMVEQMRDLGFADKAVLDFGTGTGILAILAEKLGAKRIVAIDNDDWSIENARENAMLNDNERVVVEKADAPGRGEAFDIILANINKNIILDNFPAMVKQLAPGGVLIISGLLTGDESDISAEIQRHGMKVVRRLERHNWLSLKLSR